MVSFDTCKVSPPLLPAVVPHFIRDYNQYMQSNITVMTVFSLAEFTTRRKRSFMPTWKCGTSANLEMKCRWFLTFETDHSHHLISSHLIPFMSELQVEIIFPLLSDDALVAFNNCMSFSSLNHHTRQNCTYWIPAGLGAVKSPKTLPGNDGHSCRTWREYNEKK